MKKIAPPRTGVSYFGNRFLPHALRDLDVVADCCDYVVHAVNETDFYFHKAATEKIFSASRRKGLEVWADPWGLGGVFGGEALSKFLLDHPDDWQVLSDGRRVPAACPNRDSFKNFVREWVTLVRDSGAEVIFWDEPHIYFHWNKEWEGTYACVCPACRDLYRQRFGGDMPAQLDDSAREFRRRTLSSFLDDLTRFAAHQRLKNALCLYAFEGYAEYDRIWKQLAALPKLDVFGCDPYWRWSPFPWKTLLSKKAGPLRTPAAYVKYFSEKVLAETRDAGKGSQIWLQAMRFPRGAEKEILPAAQAAAEAGVTHLAAWSYDGGALLDTVLSENPERVWKETARAFRHLKGAR
ncbi:MAG TPA: hypothetical protein P5079_01330 [Elusimicrobiota bacterium]|nr:hypothetical protein [Elusimicrobiota bacterium]